MRHIRILLLICIASLVACDKTPVEVIADLTLDELNDKEEYTGGMVVDYRSYMGKDLDKVLVNGLQPDDPYVLELHFAGYYRIEIWQGRSAQGSPQVIRIVILDPVRGNPEWGLPPWTPAEHENGVLDGQTVSLIHSPFAPPDVDIPLVVVLGEELTLSDTYLDAEIASAGFRIKRGVGSVQIPGNSSSYTLKVDQDELPLSVDRTEAAPVSISGVLSADMHIPANSYIHIPADLSIPSGITLRIENGCFITVAPEVNIQNDGTLYLSGTAIAPVTVTCSNNTAYWGGIIGSLAGNRVEAYHTIFSRSGHHTGDDYNWGHAHRQALFYSNSGSMKLDHCYMTDHIGQVFYPLSSTLDLSNCLVQRAKTGGQMNQSELVMDRCIFTDFPDDSNNYRDNDNDGLYLDECDALISNSIFMYAKDDGLDSGASGGGEVIVTNTIFESVFHEGAALSSGHSVTKLHRFSNCLFSNCGQGIELGYSSPNHQVEVESCSFIRNGIGIRYGDCYDFPHRGFIHVSNSESLENTVYDVWNMNKENWAADTSHMSFENVLVSKANDMYPQLIINE